MATQDVMNRDDPDVPLIPDNTHMMSAQHADDKTTADAEPLDLKTLRSIDSKAIKAILAGIVAYNTAHRLFTKEEDRDRDIRKAMYKILEAKNLGKAGLYTFAASAVNYLKDNARDKVTRARKLFGYGGKRRKLLTRKRRRA